MCEQIHRKHGTDIRTGVFNRQHFSLFIFTGFSRVFPSRLSCVALAFPVPICQHAFVSTYHANIRMAPFPPFAPPSPLPVIEIPVAAIIHAMTLSEVIVLTITAPIHGEPLPAFHPIRSPYYIIQRRSDLSNASLVSLPLNDGPCLYIYQRQGA